jgi:excisionase family DNA binding protein
MQPQYNFHALRPATARSGGTLQSTANEERRPVATTTDYGKGSAGTALAPRYGSYRTASALYGLSRTTLAALVESGEIRAARVGRAVRLDFASIEGYMNRQADKFGDEKEG